MAGLSAEPPPDAPPPIAPVVVVAPPPAAPPPGDEGGVDVPLHWRVLWRFKFVVFIGLIAAFALSVLSFAHVSFADGKPKLTPRASEEWVSFARLFVTRPGFQWGETTPESVINKSKEPGAEAERIDTERAAEERLTTLAIIYARLIDTDGVRSIMLEKGPIDGRIEAAPVAALDGESEVLPIISVAGIAATPEASRELTARAAAALKQYIISKQERNDIDPRTRVVMTLIKKAGDTKLLTPRSKTLPIVVFLTVMVGVVAICFLLENLRPRARFAVQPRQTPAAGE